MEVYTMEEYYLVKVKVLAQEELDNLSGMDLDYLEENYDGTCYKFFKNNDFSNGPLHKYTRWVYLNSPEEIFWVAYVEPLYKFNKLEGRRFAEEIDFVDYKGNILEGYAKFSFINFNYFYEDILKLIGVERLEYKEGETVLFWANLS